MERFPRLFGKERIEAVVADREFIGDPWFPWLKENDPNIVIRIRENRKAGNSGGIFTRVSYLFRNPEIGEFLILKGLGKIGNTEVFVCGMKLSFEKYLIIVTYESPETYNRRWRIETMFACPKTRGFGFESARLGDYDRISKLLGIVAMAFARAYIIGDSSDEANPIAVRKHGYRAKSIFRRGFDFPRHILPNMSEHIDGFEDAIRAFSRSSIYFFKSHKLCELK